MGVHSDQFLPRHSGHFQEPAAALLLTASYEDKYGSLGKIAVVVGKMGGRKLYVKSWVVS